MDSPSVQRIELSDAQWVDMETRPTGRDMFRMEKLQDGESDPEVPVEMEMIAIVIRAWSFEEEMSASALFDLHSDDLLDISEFWAANIVPFLESWMKKANQSPSLKHLADVASQQPTNGRKSSSSPAGRGKSTSTRPKSKSTG